MYCDGELFDTQSLRAEEKTEISGACKLPRYGYLELKIVVRRGDKSVSSKYVKKLNALPPVKESVFLPFTRRLGLAGALEVSQGNDVAQFNSHRIEFNWSQSEKKKGVYDIGHESNIREAIEYGSSIIALINQNNSLYGDTLMHNGNLLEVPQSKESLDGFAKFTTEVQKKYIENSPIKYFEIYNEPNCFYFQGKDESYTYMAQLARMELKKNNPDEKTAIGVIADGDSTYLERLMKSGIYPHMDAVSNHPYIRPELVDKKYAAELSKMTGVITKYGGWKEQIITEIGWPTHSDGISCEQQAIELAKQAIVADYFDIAINDYYKSSDEITSPDYSTDYSEHNFGIFYQKNGTLKPAAYSISAMNYETAGAMFCGKLPFADKNIEAYLYARDGQIKCVIWTKENNTSITLKGESMKAYDMNGNFICEGNTFAVGEKPIYIHGISKDYIINSLADNIKNYLDLYIPLAFSGCSERKGFNDAKEVLYCAVENAKDFAAGYDGTEEKSLEALNAHYQINLDLIAMYKEKSLDITPAQLSGLLYLNHWGGMLYGVVYMMDSDSGNAELTAAGEYEEVKEFVDALKGENTLSYTEAILVYAKKYADNAAALNAIQKQESLKTGAVKAWDKIAGWLLTTATELAAVETVGYDNVFIQLPYSERTIKTGKNILLDISVYNYRPSQKISGYIELVDPYGRVVGTSLTFGISAGNSSIVKMPVNLNFVYSGAYTLRLISDGKELTRHTITKLFKG